MEQKYSLYKRTSRRVKPETKAKISQSLKNYNQAHPRDDEYRKKLSVGLKNYWSHFCKDETEIEDLI